MFGLNSDAVSVPSFNTSSGRLAGAGVPIGTGWRPAPCVDGKFAVRSLNLVGFRMQIAVHLRALAIGLLLFLCSGPGLHAEGRHALVVGIDAYQNVPSLEKAVNDARAVKTALTTAGFEVQLVEGADQIGFLEAIASFSASIGPGDEAVVYYAGHGVEIDGRNYLLPSDVPAAGAGQEIVLTNRSISVQDLVDALQARGARISLLILDACRDNPFPRSGTRSIGGTRGLAPAPKAEGTFILYSAGEGETALDRLSNGDSNPNSVFTRALVPLIAEPGLPLREVSRRVRSDVRQMALSVDHAQFPAVYDQLDGDFSFTVATSVESAAADPCATARADWWLVRDSEDEKAIQRFLAAYPDCPLLQALGQGQLDEARESVALKFQNSEEVWAQIFETQVGLPYKNAKFVQYTGVLQSPCGRLRRAGAESPNAG